ncbi:hypothetical protein EDD86DRAFT_97922 [Gorgonomyces haynaldii]|nr:hypothetical protein EDD86DRAFT_97922 [Gorgonomyces haynaldii]
MASEHPGTEHSENKGGLRPTKYFLTLSKDQKKVYRSWIGVQRFIYNRCVAFRSPENVGLKTGKRVVPTIKKLRCVNNEAYKGKALAWVLDHSYDLRDEAARDFFKNVKSSLAKGHILNLKKVKKQQQRCGSSMSVLAKHWNKDQEFCQLFSQDSCIAKRSHCP